MAAMNAATRPMATTRSNQGARRRLASRQPTPQASRAVTVWTARDLGDSVG
jgi:hypothetical protein